MSTEFVDAIAVKTSRPAEEIEAILLRQGIVDSPTPPTARPLRLRRLAFSGEKNIHGSVTPFAFSWEPKEDGAWAVASDENFAGKSTIFQVMLWVIRGERKALTDTALHWVRHVEADLEAGGRKLRVGFDVRDDVPVGAVEVLAAEGKVAYRLEFDSDDKFKAHMNSLMLDALDLEPIAASRKVGADDDVIPYFDGWVAYTGALLFDGDSKALIGEVVGTDLAQRLLSFFLGLPWATTQMQARARRKVVESELATRKRQFAQLSGSPPEAMQARLKEIQAQIADGSAKQKALAELERARQLYNELSSKVTELHEALTVVRDEVAQGERELNSKKRDLLEIEEEQVARQFLGGLSPTCCPRCTRTFDKSRLQNEQTGGSCSVCLSEIEADDEIDFEAIKSQAKDDVKAVSKLFDKAKKEASKLEADFKQTRLEQEAAAKQLTKLSASGTAQEEQKLRLEAARLEGSLEAVSKLVRADTGQGADLDVLKAAEDIAGEKLSAAAEAVLKRSGELVRDLAKELGIEDIEEVTLKRNAHVDIRKGGSNSTFGGLSPGERLRIRIATVVSLLKAAEQFGVGRHPGLVIVDSPAKEEMSELNIEAMLGALAGLEKSVGVQLFVGFRGTELALQHFPEERCLLARGNAKLW